MRRFCCRPGGIAAGLLLLVLAGCGGGGSSDLTGETTTPVGPAAVTSTCAL